MLVHSNAKGPLTCGNVLWLAPHCTRYSGLIIRRSRVQAPAAPQPLTCGNASEGTSSFPGRHPILHPKLRVHPRRHEAPHPGGVDAGLPGELGIRRSRAPDLEYTHRRYTAPLLAPRSRTCTGPTGARASRAPPSTSAPTAPCTPAPYLRLPYHSAPPPRLAGCRHGYNGRTNRRQRTIRTRTLTNFLRSDTQRRKYLPHHLIALGASRNRPQANGHNQSELVRFVDLLHQRTLLVIEEGVGPP